MNTENLLTTVKLLGQGMLAIFLVVGVIFGIVKIFNIIDKNNSNKTKINKTNIK